MSEHLKKFYPEAMLFIYIKKTALEVPPISHAIKNILIIVTHRPCYNKIP
jgi:hypothetical protein